MLRCSMQMRLMNKNCYYLNNMASECFCNNRAFEQMLGRVVKTMNSSGRKTEKKKMKIKEARTILEEAEMEHV